MNNCKLINSNRFFLYLISHCLSLTNSHGYEKQLWCQPLGKDVLHDEDDDGDHHEGEEYEVGDEEDPIVLPQTVKGETVA